MRVQFTVSDSEWERLELLADSGGWPDVPSFCRDVALDERTYRGFWHQVREKVAKMPSGEKFALRDLVPAPPANLGVALFKNQGVLGIKILKKDCGINIYTKL